MGPGDWSAPLGFSVRKLLFILIIVMFFLHYFHYRQFKFIDIKLFLIGSLFFTFFGLVIPAFYGVDLSLSIADVRPLAGLLLIPFMVGFYKRSNRWRNDRKFVSVALVLLAFLHVFLWFLGGVSREWGEVALSTMRSIYEPGVAVIDSKIIAVNYTLEGTFRVQWTSSSFLLLGLYFGFSQLNERRSFYNFIYLFVCCLAIYVTQSRGLVFAIFLGVGHYFVFYYFIPLKDLGFRSYFFALSSIFLFSMLILPFFTPEFLEMIGVTREGSDSERSAQIFPLIQNWLNHLFFGSGFGSGIEVVRSETVPYSFEVSILSLLMKVGVVGIGSALIICSALLAQLFHGLVPQGKKRQLLLIFSMVFVYIIASNTNPYLSNFFGMLTLYCFTLDLANYYNETI